MHQPNYQEPASKRLLMPWVRLHALKDYLDMPLLATAHENVKVTFNLVPSLIDQLELYANGGTDRHLDLSRLDAESLSIFDKREILQSFFSANPTHMIAPHSRYHELFEKASSSNGGGESLAALFSSSEIRDIQVWSNLCWVDPLFRNQDPIKSLLSKGRHFTEEEKRKFLDWQFSLMAQIVPTYKSLYLENRIDISFTPYYHPILPLLCDTDSAREAIPDISLPKQRFIHPEDALAQIRMSGERFQALFGRPLTGMWPSEGSVSENALALIAQQKIAWAASDEEILYHSLRKSGKERPRNALYSMYQFKGLKLFFRDHVLSDRIGFVYSGWPAERAVSDFIGHLKQIRERCRDNLNSTVVPVILDGENAWEYFPDDAHEFLTLLYQRLSSDSEIRMVTMTEAAQTLTSEELPSVFAGSWINHNFRIWIGHAEDNAAWDLLTDARDALSAFSTANPRFDKTILQAAWTQIYIAEGSDWCWWYGDDHQGFHNQQFDIIFRKQLMAVYSLIGLNIPEALFKPISLGLRASTLIAPEGTISPKIDGRISYYYEWSGAGIFDCLKAGGTMHRVDRLASTIYFGFDRDYFYLRVDLTVKKVLNALAAPRLVVGFQSGFSENFQLKNASGPADQSDNADTRYAFDENIEIAIRRNLVQPDGFGLAELSITFYDGEKKLESWPEQEMIAVTLPEPDKELFWPF